MKKSTRVVSVFCVSALICASCAYAAVRYYGMQGVDYNQGKLLGPKPKDDLPFSACAPIGNDAYPCVIMFAKDFFALKQEFEDTKMRLRECEKKANLY